LWETIRLKLYNKVNRKLRSRTHEEISTKCPLNHIDDDSLIDSSQQGWVILIISRA